MVLAKGNFLALQSYNQWENWALFSCLFWKMVLLTDVQLGKQILYCLLNLVWLTFLCCQLGIKITYQLAPAFRVVLSPSV